MEQSTELFSENKQTPGFTLIGMRLLQITEKLGLINYEYVVDTRYHIKLTLQMELDNLKDTFININNYPESLINKIIKQINDE